MRLTTTARSGALKRSPRYSTARSPIGACTVQASRTNARRLHGPRGRLGSAARKAGGSSTRDSGWAGPIRRLRRTRLLTRSIHPGLAHYYCRGTLWPNKTSGVIDGRISTRDLALAYLICEIKFRWTHESTDGLMTPSCAEIRIYSTACSAC